MSRRVSMLLAVLVLAAPVYAFYPEWVAKAPANIAASQFATGDMNEDGLPDVVIRASNAIATYLMTANATVAVPYAGRYAGTYLTGLVVADANGDGHLDVIVSEGAPDSVLPQLLTVPGNGDGTFGTPVATSIPFSATEIIGGDFDGDGTIDVAVRSYGAALLAIYTGDGAGGFTQASTAALPEMAWKLAAGDVDNDGHDDVVVGSYETTSFRVFFGRGDGTLDAPLELATSDTQLTDLHLADLDADGDLEILLIHFSAWSLNVVMNTGGRTFAGPVTYVTSAQNNPYGDPFDVTAGDIDGDGKNDVVVTVANSRSIATFLGNGDGTLRPAVYTHAGTFSSNFPHYLSLVPVTGDGRVDLVLAASSTVTVFENRSGDLNPTVQAVYPTITEGQTARFRVTLCPAGINPYTYGACDAAPLPEGTITLESDGAEIASVSITARTMEIDVSSLPLGAHSVTATFAGDGEYHAATSEAVTQNVVAERTTITLRSNAPDSVVEYGQSWTLSAEVTSELVGPLNGPVWLYTNGVRSQYTQSGPSPWWSQSWLAPGTYEFYAVFEGTATQPPSTSNTVTQVVRKGTTTTVIQGPTTPLRYSGQNYYRIYVSTSGYSGGSITPVRLYEGDTLLATVSGSSYVSLSLPVGVHYLHAVFEGNAYYEPSRSALFRYAVVADTGFLVDAYATGTTIRVQGFPPNTDGYFTFHRRIGTGAWAAWKSGTFSTLQEDLNVQPGVAYAYRIEQFNWSNQVVAYSAVDNAMAVTFTDDPLAPGTAVKALHLMEILAATNALRAAGGLAPIQLPGAASGQGIRAEHIVQLRAAINEGRFGLGVGNMTWYEIVEPGVPIRAAHLRELRDALR